MSRPTDLPPNDAAPSPADSDEETRARNQVHQINASLFGTGATRPLLPDNSDAFPLHIRVTECCPHDLTQSVGDCILAVDVIDNHNSVGLHCTTKPDADRIVVQLIEKNHNFLLDYSDFISHPGNLFVKNLSALSTSHDSLSEFFQKNSRYSSLSTVNIFNSADETLFAILKFDNYLDVDYLLESVDTSVNPFHHLSTVPLYMNRYISKRERKLKAEELTLASLPSLGETFNVYNTLVVENLGGFFSGEPTFEELGEFIAKFELFHKVVSVYFPLNKVSDTGAQVSTFGFIEFESDSRVNENVLRCLYHLSNLLHDKFTKFSAADITPVTHNEEFDETPSTDSGLIKLSIGQHKHNHYLYQLSNDRLALNWESRTIPTYTYIGIAMHNTAISRFSRHLNYQETNIYVNNFPVVFENNDELWETFWKQFGCVKLAKIIKPHFYSKKTTESTGKIGFVFFENFRLAVRAILLTNDRTLTSGEVCNQIHVETSFAIQKNNHGSTPSHNQRPSLPTNYFAPTPHEYIKRFSWPSEEYYLSPPHIPPVPEFAPMYPPYMFYNYPYMIGEPSEDYGYYLTSPPPSTYFVRYDYGAYQRPRKETKKKGERKV